MGNFLTDLENDSNADALTDSFENKNILDLGCGAGVLGILALKSNAKSVTFQDFVGTSIERIKFYQNNLKFVE